MRYEWDEVKNRQNQKKHDGISFEFALLVFEDERCFISADHIDSAGEQRWHAVGAVQIEGAVRAVLLVVHVYRKTIHGEEIIRIISAREADKHDIRRYQEQGMD